jgi:hypothetical protein
MRCAGQRQVDALSAPGRRALPQRIERERAILGVGCSLLRTALARHAQDLEEGLDEIGLLEGRLLEVVPGIERLHDAAVDRRRHGGHHQHRHARAPLVDRVDQRDAGVALAPQLDVQQHDVVVFARERRLGAVAVEPLVHLHLRPRSADPSRELVAGGQVVLDHGDTGHADDYGMRYARPARKISSGA